MLTGSLVISQRNHSRADNSRDLKRGEGEKRRRRQNGPFPGSQLVGLVYRISATKTAFHEKEKPLEAHGDGGVPHIGIWHVWQSIPMNQFELVLPSHSWISGEEISGNSS